MPVSGLKNITLKNSYPLGVVMFLRDYTRKVSMIKKNCDARQKSRLKVPPLVVDSLILVNFLIGI